MKRLIARLTCAALVAVLYGCATTAGMTPTQTRSGFDGATVVDIQPHGAACKNMTCIAIGAQWASTAPDVALLTVSVVNATTTITGVAVAIDGKPTALQPPSHLTTHGQLSNPLRESRKTFVVPLDLVRRMAGDGDVWVRVSTPAGSLEDPINSPGGDSKALHAMRRFLASVDAAAPLR